MFYYLLFFASSCPILFLILLDLFKLRCKCQYFYYKIIIYIILIILFNGYLFFYFINKYKLNIILKII